MSLVSLRKKDLSEETLEAHGIDITYLSKSKFDPTHAAGAAEGDATEADRHPAPPRLRRDHVRPDRRRRCGGIPTILHEHANLTDTPWFQKVADAVLEPDTDIALAVSQSTADFVVKARQIPPDKVKVVYLGVPLDEFSRPRTADEIAAARGELGSRRTTFAIGTVTRLHESKGNSYLVDAAAAVVRGAPRRTVLPGRRGAAAAVLRGAGAGARPRRPLRLRRLREGRRAGAVGVRPERVSVVVGRHAAHRVRGAGHGQADCGDRRRRPDRRPDARSRCADRAQARCRRRSPHGIVQLLGDAAERQRLGAAARQTAQQYSIQTFVDKMEQLYELLHRVSRKTHRRGVLAEDLSFLTSRQPA